MSQGEAVGRNSEPWAREGQWAELGLKVAMAFSEVQDGSV